MPFSAGVFSRVYSWATEQLSSPIEIAKLDTQEADIATGLSNCILRDGTGLPTAAINWGGQKLQNLAAGTLAGDAAPLSQQQGGAFLYLGSVAGTNTITGTLTPTLTAYTNGMLVKLKPANDTAGAATLNIDSLGAKSIVKEDGRALESGDMQASTAHVLVYDGTNFVLLNPMLLVNQAGALNASASEVGFKGLPQVTSGGSRTCVLSDAGKHIMLTGSSPVGTIPENASVAYPTGTVLTFLGNHSGTATIAITSDSMYLAGTAFGTTGTRTLARGGVATAFKFNPTEWLISGTGLS